MKKVIFALMFSSVLMACGTGSGNAEQTQDSTQVAIDTVSVDSANVLTVEEDSVTEK